MKTKINLIIILAMGFLSIFSSKAQNRGEQSDYYYQGYTFKNVNGVKAASPYLTVLLYEEGNKMPKAVLMSNAIGQFSFQGVPVNLYIQNSFKVYAGDKYIGTYLQGKVTKKLPFASGNIGSDLEVPNNLDYCTIEELVLPKKAISVREFLSKNPHIEIEDGNFYAKGANGSLRVFVNNTNPPLDKLKKLFDLLTTDNLKSCQLILYKKENKYFSGAINLTLVVGDPGKFPTDTQYIKSLPIQK